MSKTKRIGSTNANCENIESRYWNGIWQRKMYHACNEKRQITHDGRNQITQSRKISTHREMETFKYEGILKADNIKQLQNERKSGPDINSYKWTREQEN